MAFYEPKPGGNPSSFTPIHDSPDPVRHGAAGVSRVQTTKPWWNARYWPKKVWAGVAAIVVIVIVIAVAVGVTQSKKDAYPNYTELSYSLKDTFEGENFFDNFDYFTGYDPTSGFVHYVPESQATSLNLTYASSTSAVLRVDTSVGPTDNPDASTGRFSVRITSRNTYDDGLFIFDVKHTPYGCGTWPALWLTDPSNWPDNGEIDVVESINQGTDGNQMTLHTSSDCSMDVRRKQSGSVKYKNCDQAKNDNAGCGVVDDDDSYGPALNKAGGAVMALEWRDAGIRMWQFARGSIPSDITSKNPKPDTWGTATADFPSTDCNIGNHFRNNSIVANIDLCGDLVYSSWDSSGCSSNCSDWVANNPDAFTDAYWEFGTFQVYKAS
ncbi:Glycosyl hydrolases family 16 [Geosmithia morbida]|uniref:endo-1,3(4)-beta-glucanase n=1 Tax=Geosmithia morbida TaxID=1094350 RepID=A0A9P4YP66_9HYPO|nr:Glycosyl hydrolases family 16 [Geosmithia morbida]KAF4120578.1 Glycosyl hydrolases family 16 [Geosmithia morbida]